MKDEERQAYETIIQLLKEAVEELRRFNDENETK